LGKLFFIGNVSEGIIKRNYTGSTIRIRGNSSQKNFDAKDYNTNIDFEKITISSEIGVRFALD
jgi:hypothetical protein